MNFFFLGSFLFFVNFFLAALGLFFFFFNVWLCWVFVAERRLSLVAASWGYSVVVRRLLIVVASLVVEHGL